MDIKRGTYIFMGSPSSGALNRREVLAWHVQQTAILAKAWQTGSWRQLIAYRQSVALSVHGLPKMLAAKSNLGKIETYRTRIEQSVYK